MQTTEINFDVYISKFSCSRRVFVWNVQVEYSMTTFHMPLATVNVVEGLFFFCFKVLQVR